MAEIFRSDRRFFYYSLIFFTSGFSNLLAMPLYPIFLVDILHASNTLVGKLSSISSFFWIISYLFWGRYVDKKGPIQALSVSFLLTSFVPLLYAVASNLWFIVLASIITGFNVGSVELARIDYITRISKSENVQTYWGVDYTLMGIRGITAPFIGVGLMSILGIREALLISFLMKLTSFILMRWFCLRYGKDI